MFDESQYAVVIEDDHDICELLCEVLRRAGFHTVAASNGLDGIAAVRRYAPVITTIDLALPGIDGYETAKRIRELSSSYIFIISARSEEIDVLQGLDAGADDYVTKPFRTRELRARIEAMLRRPRQLAAVAADEASQLRSPWLEHRGLRLNPNERRVEVNGVEISLTRTEFNLLEQLMRSGTRVCTKTELAEVVQGSDSIAFLHDLHGRHSVDAHLTNLRRKIGESSNQPRWFETVRGVGYRLCGTDSIRPLSGTSPKTSAAG